MKEVESYKITWNHAANEGILLLHTNKGQCEQILVDSPAEAQLLLDILRHEKPVFIKDGLIFTGFEAVGEEEPAASVAG